jgi:UDP-3-O-[3-hydroxymyristoyl] N-acetylglucosamine deacetylase
MAGRVTLAREVFAQGVALHAGVAVTMRLMPAAADTGLVFRRTGIAGDAIAALWPSVSETRLGTVLKGKTGASVAVVEHCLAALYGAGIDDCLIEVDGPELPALDGDAASFLALLDRAGKREQEGARRFLRVVRKVEVASGESRAALLPCEAFELYCEIDFESRAIGRQSFGLTLTEDSFRHQIAPARTFGFLDEAEKLRAMGLARGASLENTLVIDGDRLVNAHLKRFSDEFVRHKILDTIGDLALAGAPLLARYEATRPSHTLNNRLLAALFAEPGNYEYAAGPA